MAARPIPIAIRIESGIVLRGHEWSQDGLPVLLVHDLGGDLDDWGTTPSVLAGAGFRVMSVELRGHGLSEGEPDPELVRSDMVELLHEVAGSFGPVAVVVCGAVAEAAFYLDERLGAPVHILASPQPLDPAGIDWSNSTYAMRLVAVGAKSEAARGYADRIYPELRGPKLWVATGTEDQGPELLSNHPSVLEQVAMFVRRYLTAHHLAWIAEHEDDIEAAAHRSDT